MLASMTLFFLQLAFVRIHRPEDYPYSHHGGGTMECTEPFASPQDFRSCFGDVVIPKGALEDSGALAAGSDGGQCPRNP